MATSGVPVPSLEIQTVGEKNRLQKPMVQKIRRDRINGSIEQLKLLQEKEFQRHQPNSKLEKADVLEMTVSYLKCSQSPDFTVSILASKSYSSRLKETLQFLAIHSTDSKTQSKLLRHFQKPLGDDRHMHHSDPHSAPQGITQEGNIKANLQTLEALVGDICSRYVLSHPGGVGDLLYESCISSLISRGEYVQLSMLRYLTVGTPSPF